MMVQLPLENLELVICLHKLPCSYQQVPSGCEVKWDLLFGVMRNIFCSPFLFLGNALFEVVISVKK